jgi:RNA polymerase sigma-70 factor (ECF subfamily)
VTNAEPASDRVAAELPRHLGRLWRFAVSLCGRRDVADDLVQATCLRALERSQQFVVGTRIDRWLFAILASIWKNQARSERVRLGFGIEDPAEVLLGDASVELETNILLRQVLTQVQALPWAQRAAVLLVYVEGFTYAEAATALEVPIGTIMSRLAAARATLGEQHRESAAPDAMPRKQVMTG